MKRLMSFGSMDLNFLVSVLFWIGNLPIALLAFIIGNRIFLTNTYNKIIYQSGNLRSYEEVQNLPLGVFAGIIAFVSGVVIWRIICDFIFIIIRYFKNNTKPHIGE